MLPNIHGEKGKVLSGISYMTVCAVRHGISFPTDQLSYRKGTGVTNNMNNGSVIHVSLKAVTL